MPVAAHTRAAVSQRVGPGCAEELTQVPDPRNGTGASAGCARRTESPPRGTPVPDLFSPFTLKGVTLRNRIAMSPMTIYGPVDGRMDDYHVMYLGARAAGGFGLDFPEQIAITPDG